MTSTLVDNIITLSFNSDKNNHSVIEIVHNNIELYRGELFSTKTFEIKTCKENNTLVIKNITYEQLDTISMFNLGNDKLKHLLTYENNRAVLNYNYPVFPWLHQTLNFGWIVKSI